MCSTVVKSKREVMLTWIIPVCNGEKYIAQAIESILRQPCTDLQIIVVDDGSTDATAEIVQTYLCDRIQLICKENGGVSSARNVGIHIASSRYLAFLDADDIICKDAYTDDIRDMLSTDQYDLISFSYFLGDSHLQYGNRIAVTSGEVCGHTTQLDPFKHCSSFIYHSKLFEGNNAIQFPEGIKIREDVTFQFLAYQRANNILNISKDWFVYRNNPSSVTHRARSYKYIPCYTIPAWVWAKDHCITAESAQHCDNRLFWEVTAYIRSSCIAGLPLEKIFEVLEIPAVKAALSNYDILWDSSRIEYETFVSDPVKYRRKYRFWGWIRRTIKLIIPVSLVRKCLDKIKYKENIASIV